MRDSECLLPFDCDEVVNNLRQERYSEGQVHSRFRRLGKSVYYLARPALPLSLRSRLKRFALNGWEKKVFPSWPADRTVDRVHEKLMSLAMKTRQVSKVPFIWFWPKGQSGCVAITHDVETRGGLLLPPDTTSVIFWKSPLPLRRLHAISSARTILY